MDVEVEADVDVDVDVGWDWRNGIEDGIKKLFPPLEWQLPLATFTDQSDLKLHFATEVIISSASALDEHYCRRCYSLCVQGPNLTPVSPDGICIIIRTRRGILSYREKSTQRLLPPPSSMQYAMQKVDPHRAMEPTASYILRIPTHTPVGIPFQC